jgi:hypothetical protein
MNDDRVIGTARNLGGKAQEGIVTLLGLSAVIPIGKRPL